MTPKVNIWLLMKDEQSLVKFQNGGSNELGIRWICYLGKLMKRGIQWNQNQVISNYNQTDVLFSKLEIFRTKNWGKWRTLRTNLQNYTSKSNKNSNYLLIINRISLLTRLPQEWGFNSRGLKRICSDSSSWTFGIQGENSMKSRRNSWSVPLQLLRNRV